MTDKQTNRQRLLDTSSTEVEDEAEINLFVQIYITLSFRHNNRTLALEGIICVSK